MGNVLLKYDPAAMLEAFGITGDDAKLCLKAIFESPEWAACDRGDGYREEILEPLISALPQNCADACRKLLYRDDLELSFMPEIPGMFELLSELKKAGYRLYLLSNVGLCYEKLYAGQRIFALFDGLFPSSEYHLLKPDNEIYEAFYGRFKLDPSNCIFVDDSRLNCLGAENTGMKAVCFNGCTDTVGQLKKELMKYGITTLAGNG